MEDEQELVERLKRHETSEQDRTAQDAEQATYKRAQDHFNNVFRHNEARAVRVNAVHVTGTGALCSREPFLQQRVAPIAKSRTVGELLANIDRVHGELAGMGVYDQVGMALDESPKATGLTMPIPTAAGILGTQSRPDAPNQPLEIDALVHLHSAKRFLAKTGTDIGNGEGSGYINMTWKNAFGGAEVVAVDASLGTTNLKGSQSQTSYQASLALPVAPAAATPLGLQRAEIMSYIMNRALPWSSADQRARGITAKVASPHFETGLEAAWRTVSCTANASAGIRKLAGSDIKTGLFWAYTKSSHDHALLPTQGVRVRIHQELAAAGCGQPLVFLKSTIESSLAFSALQKRIIGKLAVRGGAIHRLGLAPGPTPLLDRFYVGGPNDLRGFNLNGAGPHERGDALGGDAFAVAGFSLLTPLARSAPLYLAGFVNAGGVGPLQSAMSIATRPSVAAGFGLVYCHPSARFELNFTLPLVARELEGTRKGLQFGVGFSFL